MKFKLKIFTPEREKFTGDVDMVVIPGEQGDLGILARHAPLLAKLRIGHIKIKNDGKESFLTCSGGFVEVSDNVVSLFLDTCEFKEEIDVERAKAAKERAEKRLSSKSEEIDYARAQAALERALNRLKLAEMQ